MGCLASKSAGAAAELLSFTLLTAAAHENMRELHHRQPSSDYEQALDWLDPSNAQSPWRQIWRRPAGAASDDACEPRGKQRAQQGATMRPGPAPPYEVSANTSFKAADLSTMDKAKPVEQESFIADS